MASATADGLPRRRAPELEDPLNRYLYHPLAARLARLLVPTGVSPNMVSVAGAVLVWLAAWSYAALAWPYGAVLGFLLHMGWHVLDGADGDLARMSGKASPTGELVDGLCDYAANIPLYFVLAAILDDSLGAWAWVLAVAAGASHLVQTNHAEAQRRCYLWRAYGVPWLKHAEDAGDHVFAGRSRLGRAVAGCTRFYIRVAYRMAPWSSRLDALVDKASGDPARLAAIRAQVRSTSKTSLAYEKLLGPNPRTIILGLAMLAQSPVWYFLAEIVLLNALLLASVVQHNAAQRRLVAALGGATSPPAP